MASILDLVKHYQHFIEKYPNDEQKVLKSIDKLYNLGVTVQHLQETGVGRTVNALRKEPGEVGQAARALVYKWKVMVAAEESDQEGEHNNDTSNYNGHEHGRDYDSNPSESRNRHDKSEKYDKTQKIEEKHHIQTNGDHSGSKRKYHSSEEEDPDTKKSKYSSSKDNGYIKPEVKVKVEPSDSEQDSQDDTSSESDSDGSHSSEDERKPDVKVKIEKVEKTEKHGPSSKQSSIGSHYHTNKHESSSESAKEHYKHNASESRHSSEKTSKDKTNSSQSYKSPKEGERSIKKEKEHRSDKEKSHREKSSDRHRSSKESEKHKSSNSSEKHKSNGSSEKHKSGSISEKHKHSSSSEKHRSDSSSAEKHRSSSNSEKHKSSSSEKHRSHSDKGPNRSEKHSSSKSEKDKHKSSSEKEISSDKHKSKETNSSSSKDKHSSSGKEKSKDKHSSSKEKESTHKNDKKRSKSKEVEMKSSDGKQKSDSNHDDASSKKSKHKSSSSSSKSSSSKSKDEIPKKQTKTKGEHSDDGIDCGSGASFAEALGMISPAKPKKKSLTKDNTQSPNSSNEDLSPAALLAPNAKLAPLPVLEISALPEISPNYRPRPPPKFLPHFTDEDAMSCVISSKNQRTKVYSGNKVMGKIPSLYEMCVHVLQEHIDALEYTGGVPYEILKPVVDRATPQQLFVLEHYNPYLMEDTDHLWQKFCEKSFRTKKRQEFETWREMYMRCQEEQEIRLKSLTNNIRIAQEAKKAPIKQTKMAYVDSVVKPPRNILKKQAQHGTAFAATASPAARVAALAAAPNVLKGGRAAAAPVLTPSGSAFKPKKAPLMQKALQFMRGRKR